MEVENFLAQKIKKQKALASAKELVNNSKDEVKIRLQKAKNEVLESEKKLEYIKSEIEKILDNRNILKKKLALNFLVLLLTLLISLFYSVSIPFFFGLIYTGLKIPEYIKSGKRVSKKKEEKLHILESSETHNLYDLEGNKDELQALYRNIKYQLENIETEQKANDNIIKYLTEQKNPVITKSEMKSSSVDLEELRRKRVNPNIQNG